MKTIREYIDLIESAQAPLAENTGRSLDNAHQRAVIKINKMLKDPSISPVRRAELEQWKKEQMASMKMARGASIIPKNKLPLPEQGVAEGEGGLGQVAGIGINGKQFNFSIKDLIAKAQNYPIKKLNPQLFVKQLADRHEDPKQTAARAQAADLQYPIIVVQDGNTLMIADGTHRAQKAIMNKLPSINAYVIPVEDMAEFSKQGVTEGEISQQYTVAVDCGEDGTFTVKVHAGDKGEALRKAQKIVRNEYDTYPEGARIVGQGVAEGQATRTCPQCDGSGEDTLDPTKSCRRCGGKGHIPMSPREQGVTEDLIDHDAAEPLARHFADLYYNGLSSADEAKMAARVYQQVVDGEMSIEQLKQHIAKLEKEKGVAEGETSQQYTVAVDCGEDGTFTVKVHAADKGEALRKAQKIVRNEYDTYPEGARIVGQGVAEALSKTDLLKQVSAELNNPEFRKQPADPTKSFTRGDHWQGAKPGDYGYTGYQGHGMPTDRAERARIRADKKKQQDK